MHDWTDSVPYTYSHPMGSTAADCVVFGLADSLEVLLIKRAKDPYKDFWALPGGFVNLSGGEAKGETSLQAATRELEEETGLVLAHLEQLYTFDEPGRDPRGNIISIAHMALVRSQDFHPKGGDDAKDARWFPVDKAPPLAFDHHVILSTGVSRLRAKVRYQPIGFNLLPETFTLSDLQRLYEVILGRTLDKSNFRSRILEMGILSETGEYREGPHRPARLFRFDPGAYGHLTAKGFNFEV